MGEAAGTGSTAALQKPLPANRHPEALRNSITLASQWSTEKENCASVVGIDYNEYTTIHSRRKHTKGRQFKTIPCTDKENNDRKPMPLDCMWAQFHIKAYIMHSCVPSRMNTDCTYK